MKTAEKNAIAVQGAAAKANRIENRPSLTGKEAKKDGNPKDSTPAETPQAAETKTAEAKADDSATMDNKSAHLDEPKKTEVKEEPKAQPVKFALNLEQTLKSVGDLHRLSIQRLALIARIKTLEDFEVKLVEENDELESNPYQGCKLIIKDDKGREFITNTPNLIRMVSQFIFDACHTKLGEIEANIVFPNT